MRVGGVGCGVRDVRCEGERGRVWGMRCEV